MLESPFLNAFITAVAMAVSCAVLSVFVVCRRWAFIGEGISHSGFGGAGTAWLLALVFPVLNNAWAPYLGVIVFCTVTAIAIGYLSRGGRVHSDTAIGIFLVSSLAWGFLAQRVYFNAMHMNPHGWNTLLFGELRGISPQYTIAAVFVCAAVLLIVAMLGKEILFYCFDPTLAEASGVRGAFIHYLLMILLALLIVISVRVTGTVLATALLILPGATALLIQQTMRAVLILSVVIGFIGAVVGLLINLKWRFLPEGPAIVLTLFAMFVLTYASTKARRTRAG